MVRNVLVLVLLLLAPLAFSQTSSENASVKLHATVQASPPKITLKWVQHPGTTSITIYRKLKGATSWGSAVATPSASATQWDDNSVSVGVNYEYRVQRSGGGTGNGYISTGIEVQPIEDRGRILLLVDNSIAPQLTSELSQLTYDLRADGWNVVRDDVSPSTAATSVRNTIIGRYNEAAGQLKAVYIIGHVKVPYSGNIAPDGHSEHYGAWPCDGYYGDMDGTWTDNSVNQTSSYPKCTNVPGDGKFDQSQFPSTVELQIGRVDLNDMPAFSASEVDLVKNYLDRAHGYKVKAWSPVARGIIFDNLQWVSNPLAASAWRNIYPLVGPNDITVANAYGTSFHNLVNGQSYLWTYSSGGGSQLYESGVITFNGANNVGTTQNYVSNTSMGGVFNMSLGSYFGDWDNKNNFLRAPLAKGDALTNVWSGMPPWYFHHMAMGDNIGYSTWVTMNNSGLYVPANDGWQGGSITRIHLGLMGDPSLRMKMIAPPSNLTVSNTSGHASFSWSASSETVLGYHIYKFNSNGTITRITTSPVSGTNHSAPAVPFVAGDEYMVRAVKLEVSASGSYYNLSLGAIGSASGSAQMDCAGVAGGSALPGSACNDGNANTGNDTWNTNCQCIGQPIDCAGVAGGSAVLDNCGDCVGGNTGQSACMQDCNGVWGGSAHLDNCGICVGGNTGNSSSCTQDCLGSWGGNALPGTSCNDGNSSTINDTWNSNCQCVGTAVTYDCLGVANGSALPGTACNDNNANTGNDTWNNNCQCIGQPIDCVGVAGGNALPGTACNDGNSSTINDTWNSNCQCVGTAVTYDCLGVANGSALPGTACNDNNPNTFGDVWNQNCECLGLSMDCSNTLGGNAFIDQCGTCAGGNTGIVPDADLDADGITDCFDNCTDVQNDQQSDVDQDGVGDACDNCVWIYNPDQQDDNGNFIGDVCELFFMGINEGQSDDTFAFHPNPSLGTTYLTCDLDQARSIRLHDMAGSLIMEAPLMKRFELDHLPQGIYMAIALDAEGRPLAHTRLVRQ